MNKLILGRYFPGNSFFHRMDPRAKLIATIYFIALLFFVDHTVGYLWMLSFNLLVINMSGVSLSIYLSGIKPLILLIFIAVFLCYLFSSLVYFFLYVTHFTY